VEVPALGTLANCLPILVTFLALSGNAQATFHLLATWSTYAADGKGLWIVMARGEKAAANTYAGTLYRTTAPAFNSAPFDPPRAGTTEVGSGTFTFSDASNGAFAYTVNGISQSKPIMREVCSSPATLCR
jgi:hypothetical protein